MSKKNKPNNYFSMQIGTTADQIVLPKDLYFENSDPTRALFGLFDYLPFVREGELEQIIALINNSPTAKAICNKVAYYTVGEGFYIRKEKSMLGEKSAQILTPEQKNKLWAVLSRQNSDGDNILDICKKAAFDYQAIGNAFVQLDVVQGFTFATHQNINFVRPFRSSDLKTRFFGISADWAILPYTGRNRGYENYDLTNVPATIKDIAAYPRFTDELDEILDSDYVQGANIAELYGFDKSSMLQLKQYSPLMYQWGVPNWIGAKHFVELEYRIAKFNVSKFRNGLTTSGLLQLFGDLTPEQQKDYQEAFMHKMTDTGNDFKVIFQILENPELKANWVPFEQSYNGYFMELSTIAKDRIATGFEVPLSLVQATPGQLGNNQQIRSEFEILYRTKIYDIQQTILRGIVKPYLDTVAETENMEFLKSVELDFINIVPVSFAGELEVNMLLTKTEGRELLGYGPTLEPAIKEEQIQTEAQAVVDAEEGTDKQQNILAKIKNLLGWRNS
jgi:hypothetical protein